MARVGKSRRIGVLKGWAAHLILFPVLNLIQFGKGLFCLAFLARILFVFSVLTLP